MEKTSERKIKQSEKVVRKANDEFVETPVEEALNYKDATKK